MTSRSETRWLVGDPRIGDASRAVIEADYDRFATIGLPARLDDYLRDHHALDVATRYAGHPIANPWGKASGQLSMTAHQVGEDVDAGLGFIVLKTLIAQDETGEQSMKEWAIPESRMVVEPISGASGESGWTISWKGRGWWDSFDAYLQLVRDARDRAAGSGTLIVPSCKYHLPMPGETSWRDSEYTWTTGRLLDAWRAADATSDPMPIEKDFSPTLAGSDRATVEDTVLDWLRTVPGLIRAGAGDPGAVTVGIKLFNGLFDDAFQLRMLDMVHEPGPRRPDYLVYGNRLFDPDRLFEGHRGIAYGGPDLSDRNLRVLSAMCGRPPTEPLPMSATGNITSGRMALEYALRGAENFQLHTFFQLPSAAYSMSVGSRTAKALHELYFHPRNGLVAWMHHLAGVFGLPREPVRFSDMVGRGRPDDVGQAS